MTTPNTENGRPVIKDEVREENRIITAYSAMNNKANPNAPYSMLNPETSSDSPSEKSNGVRLVSATQEITHKVNKGTKVRTKDLKITSLQQLIDNDLAATKGVIATTVREISYEIVCATPRRAPIIENFLFDDHPAKSRG